MFPRRFSTDCMTADVTPCCAAGLRLAAAGIRRACTLGMLLTALSISPAAGQDRGVIVNYDVLNSLGELPPAEDGAVSGLERPGGRIPATEEPLRSRLLVRPQRSAGPKAAAGPPPTPRRRPALSQAPASLAETASSAGSASTEPPVAPDQGADLPAAAPPAPEPPAPEPQEAPSALPVPPPPPAASELADLPAAPAPPPPPAATELAELPAAPVPPPPPPGSAALAELPPVPEAPDLTALEREAPAVPAAPATARRAQEKEAEPPAAEVEIPPANLLRIVFASDGTELGTADETALGGLAERLRAEPDRRIELRAHAAGSGGLARRASLTRARAVRSFLVDKGVASTRIDVRPFGAESMGGPPDRVDIVDARR